MTVAELISLLSQCDPELPVFIYDTGDLFGFEVDGSIEDRVDLNIDNR